MAAIFQTTFANAFSWLKCLNFPSLVQIMAWRRPGDKPLSEPMMDSLPTRIYASRGLNELRAGQKWDSGHIFNVVLGSENDGIIIQISLKSVLKCPILRLKKIIVMPQNVNAIKMWINCLIAGNTSLSFLYVIWVPWRLKCFFNSLIRKQQT